MKIALALLTLLAVACTHASSATTDTASVLGHTLELVSSQGKCLLISGGKSIELTPAPPCYFLQSENSTPQYESYPNTGVDAVLIMSGTPISDKTRKDWGLDRTQICGSQAQGLLIKSGQVTISEKI